MIFRMIQCPNCIAKYKEKGFGTLIGYITIQDNSNFYTTLCSYCKQRTLFITKKKEAELKKLADNMNKNLWEEWNKKIKNENIKIVYISL